MVAAGSLAPVGCAPFDGEVAERSKALDWNSSNISQGIRGFESHPLRQFKGPRFPKDRRKTQGPFLTGGEMWTTAVRSVVAVARIAALAAGRDGLVGARERDEEDRGQAGFARLHGGAEQLLVTIPKARLQVGADDALRAAAELLFEDLRDSASRIRPRAPRAAPPPSRFRDCASARTGRGSRRLRARRRARGPRASFRGPVRPRRCCANAPVGVAAARTGRYTKFAREVRARARKFGESDERLAQQLPRLLQRRAAHLGGQRERVDPGAPAERSEARATAPGRRARAVTCGCGGAGGGACGAAARPRRRRFRAGRAQPAPRVRVGPSR